MIVDIHTRIWDSTEQLGLGAEVLRRRLDEPWQRPDASTSAHTVAMEPVEQAIIHGFESKHLGASIPPEKVADYVSRDPVKYRGFVGIDPAAGRGVQRLEEALDAGLVGVTISPSAQGIHPADTRAMALYEACEARGIPLFVDTAALLSRQAKMEFAQPYLLDEAARMFPNLRIVIASLGQPWIEQCMTVLAKHPTVYADLGELVLHPWQLYNALRLAYQQGVIGQILFGSNFPFSGPQEAIVTVYSLNTFTQGTHLPSVPREQLRSIVERDTLGCLGLKQPPAGASRGPGSSSGPPARVPDDDAGVRPEAGAASNEPSVGDSDDRAADGGGGATDEVAEAPRQRLAATGQALVEGTTG